MIKLIHEIDLLPFFLWPHEVEVVETYDQHHRKLKCIHCDRYFMMSDKEQAVLPWDDDFEEIIKALYDVPRSKL